MPNGGYPVRRAFLSLPRQRSRPAVPRFNCSQQRLWDNVHLSFNPLASSAKEVLNVFC